MTAPTGTQLELPRGCAVHPIALSKTTLERGFGLIGIQKSDQVFTESMVTTLPDPARRYLLHSIAPGTRLAGSVRLIASMRMRLREDADRLTDLSARETLAPPRGFWWEARFRVGPVPFRVRDHYANGDAAVKVDALGFVPIGRRTGPDIARSSRHRLAAESVWVPSVLVRNDGVHWVAIDDSRAEFRLTIDEEPVPVTLTVDDAGRLREIAMLRHGDVGVETWQPIPYGFVVEDERSFDGYTIPTRLRGGWWYGTERYEPEHAALLRVRDARFD